MPKKMQDKENVGHVFLLRSRKYALISFFVWPTKASSQLPIFDVLWMNSNQLGPMQAEWVVHIFL